MMNKSFYSSIIISFLLFVSCSEDEPIQPNNYIDPKLFGEWYLIDTLTPNIPSPEFEFRGFQINSSKQMIQLGIETSTGKVSYLEYPIIDSIIYAYNGRMLLQRYGWFGYIDTLSYRVEDEKLKLPRYTMTDVFSKTSLNSELFNPIVSDLTVNIDSVVKNNLKVFSHPSAYISLKNTSTISLFAHLKSEMLYIDMNNFDGIGKYVIQSEKGKLITIDGDVLNTFSSDSSITNTISIDQFDDINNICSGRFSFDVYDFGNYKIELREGTFIVPIYK